MEPYVYKTRTTTVYVDTPDKYKKLVNFCAENDIYLPVEADDIFTPTFKDHTPRVASKAFKNICGSESLRSDGKITPRNAYEILMHQMELKGLVRGDGSVDLNEAIQELFQTDRRRIYVYEVPELIEKIFV